MANISKEGKRNKFSKRKPDQDLDLISNLPMNVCNAILVHLPIAEAVRTSVLSRKWRYRWASIPHLVFEDLDNEVVDIVNGVLLVHEGPVHKFILSQCNVSKLDQSSYHMDQWMLFLSKHGIKQLTLGPFSDYNQYLVHSCLFSCHDLSDLQLVCCEIKLPLAFEGFHCLRSLLLCSVYIATNELERLISDCPLLETLKLEHLESWIGFKINAPRLRYLRFVIELNLIVDDNEYHEQRGVCDLIEVLGSPHHIEKLKLHGHSLQFYSMDDVPDILPTSFLRLKNLSLMVSFMDSKEVLATLCMLRSSPNLEKLVCYIKNRKRELYSTPLAVFWEAQGHLGCFLNRLRIVRMTEIMGEECELCFIRFVLANAPVLETMSIDVSNDIGMAKKLWFLQDMLQLRRASTQAIIRCDWESV